MKCCGRGGGDGGVRNWNDKGAAESVETRTKIIIFTKGADPLRLTSAHLSLVVGAKLLDIIAIF